jgi:hypothetical protein
MNTKQSFETQPVDPDAAAAIARLEQGGFTVAVVDRCPAEPCEWCPPVSLSQAA